VKSNVNYIHIIYICGVGIVVYLWFVGHRDILGGLLPPPTRDVFR